MNWTTPQDIKRQTLRLWERGKLLASLLNDEPLFPLRLTLRGPASSELASDFVAVRQWIQDLQKSESGGYRIVWREFNHRVVGRNSLPEEIWIDSLADALKITGKRAEAGAFRAILGETQARCPVLLPWLSRRPLRALAVAGQWTRLLDIVLWVRAHPFSGLYLRQIDIPGMDTKFIEHHRGILTELLDLALPPEAIRREATGAANFCRRYGFLDKPLQIRFRILDPDRPVFPGCSDQDVMVTHNMFALLNFPVRRIFITENEINFLAFPQIPESMVIFGTGYGFEALAEAQWLRDRRLHYWGDIDTHGFAILDQLRLHFPHVESLLMDRETLLHHRLHWAKEPQPQRRDLHRLTEVEKDLYDDLRHDHLGRQVRLEQEKINFSWLERALRLVDE